MIKRIELANEYIINTDGTSDGSQTKYYKDGIWYKVDRFGGEGEAERLCTILLECSNLSAESFIHYEPAIINGLAGCLSADYLKPDESFVSIYRLYQNTHGGDIAQFLSKMDYDDAIEYVLSFVREQTSLDIREYLANIFFLDMIILNEDRHFNNLNVIYDGSRFKPAPIFDNGKSLLVGNRDINYNAPIRENVKKAHSKSFSGSFELNYNYLKDNCSLKFDFPRIKSLLQAEPDSFYKKVLEYRIDTLSLQTFPR